MRFLLVPLAFALLMGGCARRAPRYRSVPVVVAAPVYPPPVTRKAPRVESPLTYTPFDVDGNPCPNGQCRPPRSPR